VNSRSGGNGRRAAAGIRSLILVNAVEIPAQADHPYATGFRVTDASGQATVLDPGQPLRLGGEEGAHELTVAVTTRYGTLAPQPLEYVVN